MPDDPRKSQSLELLQGELSEERLERLAQAFEALAQDRPQTLAFFVLQNVCQRLVSALEGEARHLGGEKLVVAARYWLIVNG